MVKAVKLDVSIPNFVKWAGGKNNLISQYKKFFPKKIERYFEPFLGGGAIFFYVKQVHNPKKIVLSDINHLLIQLYRNVKEKPQELIKLLTEHKLNHNKEYFYAMRDRFNELDNTIEKSALFLYLNRTCFNGLYRENSKGEFNVPMGDYRNPEIINANTLVMASRLLQNIELKEQDFSSILNDVKEGDFVYLDPPYHPVSETSKFTSYSKNDFTKKDQERLAEFCKKLDKKKVNFMLSNSDTPLIKELYSGFTINLVETRRMISADKTKRNLIKEVVIINP